MNLMTSQSCDKTRTPNADTCSSKVKESRFYEGSSFENEFNRLTAKEASYSIFQAAERTVLLTPPTFIL